MPKERLRAYCRTCAHPQEFVRFRPAHGWHCVFTVLTFGLWGVSWLALSLHAWLRPWRCPRCGWPLSGAKMKVDGLTEAGRLADDR
jgi:hypothetical protein